MSEEYDVSKSSEFKELRNSGIKLIDNYSSSMYGKLSLIEALMLSIQGESLIDSTKESAEVVTATMERFSQAFMIASSVEALKDKIVELEQQVNELKKKLEKMTTVIDIISTKY